MIKELNRKNPAELFPKLAKYCENIQDIYKQQFDSVIELEEYTEKLCQDAQEFLKYSEELFSECQKAEKRTILMMQKPIATLDKTLYTLMMQSEKGKKKIDQQVKSVRSLRSVSAASNKKTNKKKLIMSRKKQKNTYSRLMTPERSHIEQLSEPKRNPNEKYYCACKGRKALTFQSYTNHIQFCHDGKVPEGSSHQLDGTHKKSEAKKATQVFGRRRVQV